ncbi:MAG TPA: hypothetical protein VG713_17405 [Pirellulales bacterium]|nr:hypothetical protein [Pirellulales bacterium]
MAGTTWAATTVLLHGLHCGLTFFGIELPIAILIETLQQLLLHLRANHPAPLAAGSGLAWPTLPRALHWSLTIGWLAGATPLLRINNACNKPKCHRAGNRNDALAHGQILSKGDAAPRF